MTYKEWDDSNATLKTQLILKLQGQNKSIEEIVSYFDFDNMIIHEPTFCGLYATNTKCHNLETLNCFFCACPHFKYDDKGLVKKADKTIYSTCKINAIKGSEFISENAIHQDCTKCDIPHRPYFAYRSATKYTKEFNEAANTIQDR